MNVGDIVIPNSPGRMMGLSCGSGRYDFGIVANIQQFVVVSVDGDMIWYGINPTHMRVLCAAHPDVVEKACARYKQETANKLTISVTKDVLDDVMIALSKGIGYARGNVLCQINDDTIDLVNADVDQMDKAKARLWSSIYGQV